MKYYPVAGPLMKKTNFHIVLIFHHFLLEKKNLLFSQCKGMWNINKQFEGLAVNKTLILLSKNPNSKTAHFSIKF